MTKKSFRFYGAFGDRKAALNKAREVGGKVKEITVRTMTRYAVVTEK